MSASVMATLPLLLHSAMRHKTTNRAEKAFVIMPKM